MTLDIFVPGVPVPQGSAKAWIRGGRAHVTSDNAKLRPWRATVTAAIAETEPDPMTGPVVVDLDFVFPRPASHYGRRGLRGAAPDWPTVRPDLDKLCRACLDSLTDSGAVRDDSQVVELSASKTYGEHPGVRLVVRKLEVVA